MRSRRRSPAGWSEGRLKLFSTPAQAGAHRSAARETDRWAPAFAGVAARKEKTYARRWWFRPRPAPRAAEECAWRDADRMLRQAADRVLPRRQLQHRPGGSWRAHGMRRDDRRFPRLFQSGRQRPFDPDAAIRL